MARICRHLTIVSAALLAGSAVQAAKITSRDWGVTDGGQTVQLFTLRNSSGLEANIANYGGRIVSLWVPNRQGGRTDIELGYDDFTPYKTNGSYGALIGRYVGRISHGGTMPIGGKIYQLEKTNPSAKFVLHGGTSAFARKLFHAEIKDGPEPALVLTTTSPDGDGGFPGTLAVTITYTLTRRNELKIDYRASTDQPTWLTMTNHSYFALQGEGNGDIADQTLQVFADRYTPADADDLVTGQILPVAGTPMDFRKPVRLGDMMTAADPQIAMRKGIELSFVINGKPGNLRPAARLSDPKTGIVMDVATTQPTLIAWSDNIGDRPVTGKGGKVYRNAYSMSLETQGYLDAPNQPNFPQPMVTSQHPMHEVTVFRFTTR